ncbi:Rad17 cell cycle checkpoint protein-domain-containing protein [Lipomyces japonicus]|uniref:Rad17 cell cycle checkpoint protein-domain-containing protein n=1 Tax=Lipomyces japonicus TaxID=56871 RepID=UPI0034CDA531
MPPLRKRRRLSNDGSERISAIQSTITSALSKVTAQQPQRASTKFAQDSEVSDISDSDAVSFDSKPLAIQSLSKQISFGDYQKSKPNLLTSLKSRLSFKKVPITSSLTPWVDKFSPTTVSTLALHKKKYLDVKEWFEKVYSGCLDQRILVISGPAGSSKTAALRVLAREKKLNVVEWENPQLMPYEPGSDYISLADTFDDFLNHAQRFSVSVNNQPVDENGYEIIDINHLSSANNKVILIEDIPSVFTSSSISRQRLLNSLKAHLLSRAPNVPPIVIMISEVEVRDSFDSSSFTAETVLGRELLSHHGVHQISFNPISKMIMVKALKEIAYKESLLKSVKYKPSKNSKDSHVLNIITELAELGDIRSAINALQWWSQSVATSTGADFLRHGRQIYISRFHALGKILYNRLNDSDEISQIGGIRVSSQDIVLASVPASVLVADLFENYPPSYNEADKLDGASATFSDSQTILSGLAGSFRRGQAMEGSVDPMTLYSDLAVLGVMTSLPKQVKRQNISIKNFIKSQSTPAQFASESHGYMFSGSLDYMVYRKRLQTESIIRTHIISTRRKSGIKGSALNQPEHVASYMANTAFWESLICNDDASRRIGGSYSVSGILWDVENNNTNLFSRNDDNEDLNPLQYDTEIEDDDDSDNW